MTPTRIGLDHLPRQLWAAPLADHTAPEHAMQRALEDGASYGQVKSGLRCLVRLGLPGAQISLQAQARWPDSIDMAVLAVELALPQQKAAALDRLHRCVLHQNRRRAALAGAYLRAQRPDKARQVLEQIDLSSPSALDDVQRRTEFALVEGNFTQALADIDWLSANDAQDGARVLQLQLDYRQSGAVALRKWLAEGADHPASLWAQAFHILISEADFHQAPHALTHWQACTDANTDAISRAQTRLALERGDAQAALALLHDRLQAQPQWHWQATDHVQWLRAGQLAQDDPLALLAHARAACRVHTRHSWLHHLCRLLRESVEDWRTFSTVSALDTGAAFIAARAALRMGRPGQAAGLLAGTRHSRQTPQDSGRIMSLRAEGFFMAGRLRAAACAHRAAAALATDAAQRADAALLGAELAILAGDPEGATRALAPLTRTFPDRMALSLTQARLAFMQGDFATAMQAHAYFNALKLAQTGKPAPPDVRDRIVADANAAARGLEAAFAPDQTVTQSIAQVGLGRSVAAPGLSACLLWRAHRRGELPFAPDAAAHIPRQIAHYWQGPPGPALARARVQWARLHPGFTQQLFDDISATAWLRQTYPEAMVQRFQALTHPALRADLFRLCWILRQGGYLYRSR